MPRRSCAGRCRGGSRNPPEFSLAGVTEDSRTPSSGITANAAKTARISWLTILSVRVRFTRHSRGAMRLINTVSTTMTTVSTTAMADARADLSGVERPVVGLEGRHRGRVARAAARGDEDEVEGLQRRHHRQRQCHGDLTAQRRQRDRDEFPCSPGTVEAGGLEEFRGDVADAGQEEHQAQADVEPRADQTDGEEGEGVVAQPHPAERARARPAAGSG